MPWLPVKCGDGKRQECTKYHAYPDADFHHIHPPSFLLHEATSLLIMERIFTHIFER